MEGSSSGRPAQMMSFSDAVKNVVINNYIGFKGRASRSEYWFYFLFGLIVYVITGIIDGFVFGIEYTDPMWISNIVAIGLLLPSLSVSVRRLHDIGRSGWWYLIAIIPIVGIIIILIFMIIEGEEHPNQYGEVPTNIIGDGGNNDERYETF